MITMQKCSLKIEDRHRNAMGAVMGGVYFTLADFAPGGGQQLAGNGQCIPRTGKSILPAAELGESRGGRRKKRSADVRF